jgi:alpha-aminoadipic semialdehyde synthase
MSIDNLPAELAVESSQHFSKCLLPLITEMLDNGSSQTMENASIAKDGKLVARFQQKLSPLLNASVIQKKKILLLGSGRVALPLIDHFATGSKYELHVGFIAFSDL